MNRLATSLALTLAGVVAAADAPPGPASRMESNLKVAAVKVDITPPAGTKVVGHVREVDGVRDRLHAAALLLDDGTTRAAILTLDLLNVPPEMATRLREAVGDATGTPAGNIMVAVSHNHSGPGWAQNPEWSRKIVKDLGEATGKAAKTMTRVSVGYGEGRIDFNIQRRKVIDGRAVVRLNPEGPCDHRVKVLRFDDGKSPDPVAVLMHAVCHPCVFTWGDKWTQPHTKGFPKMSADFPGEAKSFVEKVYGAGSTALFLQGCAGDINPAFYKVVGQPRDAEPLGNMLGLSTLKASRKIQVRENAELRIIHETLALPRADLAARIASLEAEQTRLLQSLRGTSLNLKTFLPLVVKYNLAAEFPSCDAQAYLHEEMLGRDNWKRLDAENRRRIEQYVRNIRVMEELTRLQVNLALLKKHQARNTAAGKPTIDVEVLGLRVGDFLLITVPGELTVQIGLNIKSKSPHELTFVAGCTNGYIYYAPTAENLRNAGAAQEDCDCLLAPQWQMLFESKAADMLTKL